MKKEILLVVNPCAGKGKINKYISDICDNLEKQGYELEVEYTSKENNGYSIIVNYIRYIDAVIVCGGDGTLNEVINGVIDSHKKINISFIPVGTTNDFAKTVKMPRNKLVLSKKLSKFKKQEVDIGKFNDKYFYYVAAFGAFSEISYVTNQKEKNKLGRIAYFKEALRRIKNTQKIKTYQTSIVTDDEIIKDEFIYGSVSNSISIAGFKWFKNSDFSINDGLFEIILVKKPNTFWEAVSIAFSIIRKNYDQKHIYYLKTKHLKIDFDEDVTWTLDGEQSKSRKEFYIENQKGKINVLIPKRRIK